MPSFKLKLLQNISIAARMWLSVCAALSLFTLVVVNGNESLKSVSQITLKMYTHPFTVSNAVREVQYRVTAMDRDMKDLMLITSVEDINVIVERIKHNEAEVLSLFQLISERYLGSLSDVNDARAIIVEWRPVRQQLIHFMKQGQRDKAIQISRNQSAQYVMLIKSNIGGLLQFANNKAKQYLDDSTQQVDQRIQYFLLLVVSVALATVVLAYLLINSLVPPIEKLASYLQKLSMGDLDFVTSGRSRQDEIGHIARSVEKLQQASKVFSEQTEQISQGDLKTDVHVRSEHDVLGRSVTIMLTNLRHAAYIDAGMKKLDTLMRGVVELEPLSQAVLTHLCNTTETQVGCFYVVKAGIIYQTASYALEEDEKRVSRFKPGEGLIGEAMLQKITMTLSDAPDNYLKLSSASGEVSVNQVTVIPINYNEEVVALIELGLLQALTEQHKEFIQVVSVAIGTSVNSAITREREMALMDAMIAS